MGAGFGLYLNSRSHLEGWDIEVRFRSLAARLAESVTKTAIVVLTLLCISAPPAQAITKSRPAPHVEHETVPINKRSVENTVKDVKKSEDFKVHSEEHTVYDDVSGPKTNWNLDWNFDGLAAILYLLGWAGIAALIIFLGAMIYKYRHVFVAKSGPSEATAEPTRARVVMGLDVSPEALPSDVPSAAAQLWRAGDIRGALRLLYAGSLHWMIDRARLPIRESDTEGDCLRHSKQLTDQLQTSYFQSLTQIWMGHAYGHRAPASTEMEQCINQWPFRK